jgi:FlaA1/EpsC-like NDP-sugar epimerase
VELCESTGVRTRIIPGLYEILGGRLSVSQVRPVEIDDLLGREPVTLDLGELRHLLGGKTVVVTGAGGSIGSELVRQIARFSPLRVILVERSEFALYQIEEEMHRIRPALMLVPAMADVGDAVRMRELFRAYRPEVVLHAAAHKHVPLMEVNAGEAVKNNILGTLTVAEIAGEFGAETFILISTDKAVNPTSIMGTTKRVAELVIQMLDRRFLTHFVAVRFGNVLGSTGSVIPRFREQIARGGPVTVTHPEMRRYFMTIPEAAQLVLQAGALGSGGEIFILDMGKPVKIVDVARDMIRLSGLRPDEDIEVHFTGVRPGEKLFEELSTTEDLVEKTRHPKIFIGKIPKIDPEAVRAGILELMCHAHGTDDGAIRAAFQKLVPEGTVGEAGMVTK